MLIPSVKEKDSWDTELRENFFHCKLFYIFEYLTI